MDWFGLRVVGDCAVVTPLAGALPLYVQGMVERLGDRDRIIVPFPSQASCTSWMDVSGQECYQ